LLDEITEKCGPRIDAVINCLGEIQQGSSSGDLGCLQRSAKQIRLILDAVPSVFPYYWQASRDTILTSKQKRVLGEANSHKAYGWYPMSTFEAAKIIQRAIPYRLSA